MSGQYIRKYRVLVTGKSGGTAFDVSGLHCRFTVEKAVKEEPGYSCIEIYNLSRSMEGDLMKGGGKVILEAGYRDGNYGMIFSGNVVQPIRSQEDPVSSNLTLICQDGDKLLNSQFIAKTLSSGATQTAMISAIIGDAAVDQGSISLGISDAKLPRGKVMFGQASGYLSSIARSNSAQMYVENGAVNIIKAADYDGSTAVELNPMTGLIGSPTQTDDGVSVKCLINPRIKLNTLIYISGGLVEAKAVEGGENATTPTAIPAQGVYRVIQMTITGDTHGQEWYMQLECITQSGASPTGLTTGQNNPWR